MSTIRTNLGRYAIARYDDDSGQVFLILGSTGVDGGAMEQGFPQTADVAGEIYQVLWPTLLPAIKANMVVGADGQMYFLVPADFVDDESTTNTVLSFPDCDAVFDQHASAINQIKDALVEHGILGEATVTVSPDAATCVAKSNGPSTVVPMPITAVARTRTQQSIMTCVARSVDPKVNGELLIAPDPISAVAGTTMHHQWVSAAPAVAFTRAPMPTVVIS